MKKIFMAVCGAYALMTGTVAAQPDASVLINPAKLQEIHDFLNQDIVVQSIIDQNKRYADKTQGDIDDLDQQWRAETQADAKPLIAATLSNPLSAYLTRIQAHSAGGFTEIFVMDDKGLNVGQSSISSDYWQGDEAKFQKTYLVGPTAVFIDEPEFHDGTKTWRVQVNVSIAGPDGSPIGAATVETNLTELARRVHKDEPIEKQKTAVQ